MNYQIMLLVVTGGFNNFLEISVGLPGGIHLAGGEGGVYTSQVGRGGTHLAGGEGGYTPRRWGGGVYTLEFWTEKSKILIWSKSGPNGLPEVSGGEFGPKFGILIFRPHQVDLAAALWSGRPVRLTKFSMPGGWKMGQNSKFFSKKVKKNFFSKKNQKIFWGQNRSK